MTGPILVGESNPYGADPHFALYCEPPTSAGGRLCRQVMGLRRSRYVDLERYNLIEGPWSMPTARERATQLLEANPGRVFVLLGRKVATAFNLKERPAFRVIDRHQLGGGCEDRALLTPSAVRAATEFDHRFVLLPHPSGRNSRSWHSENRLRARRILHSVCPAIPWGETLEVR